MKKSKKKSVKNNNKLKYIHSLDSMRVLAMLGVMMFHLFPTKVSGGFLGVVTFFVLAGFLTMRDIVQNGNRDPLSAFGKKLRKLMPELIAMVFITVAVMSVFLSEYLPDVKNQAVSSIFGVNNLVQIADGESYFEAMASLKPFTHIWAHSMELQFYLLLLLSAGFFYKDRHKHAWIVGLSVLTVISVILMHVFYIDPDQVTRIYYGTDTRIFSFLIGMIGAIAFGTKENRIVGNGPVHSLTACVLMVLSGVLFFTVKNGASVYRFTFLFYSLLQLLLIYLLSVRKTFAYRVFGNNIFKCIAARSYSLYLWHFPVMKLYEKLMWSRNIGVFRYILFELLLILLVTEFFYRLFRWIHAKNRKRFNVPVYSAVGCMIIALCLYPYKPIGAEANQKHLLLLSLKKSISDVDVNIGTKGNVVPVTTEKQTQTQTETETENRTTSQSPSAESVIQESGDDRTVGATEASTETSVETSSGGATEVTTPTTPDSSGQTSAESTTEETTADSLPVTTEAETQVESGTGDTKAVTAPETTATTPATTETTATTTENPEIAYIRELYEQCQKDFPNIKIPFEEYLKIRDRRITLIGDSISVMTSPRLAEFFPNIQISAKSNRQSYHAFEFYNQLKAEGRIGDVVILALGANGHIDYETFDQVRADIGNKPLIINTVILPWPVTEAERNESIHKYAKERKNVFVAKWYEHCKNMPGILYDDGVHPIETVGATAHAYVMMEAVYEALTSTEKTEKIEDKKR